MIALSLSRNATCFIFDLLETMRYLWASVLLRVEEESLKWICSFLRSNVGQTA